VVSLPVVNIPIGIISKLEVTFLGAHFINLKIIVL